MECAQFRLFITSDDKFLNRAPNVELEHTLCFVTPESAVDLMGLQHGEQPSMRPAVGTALSQCAPWWIP
jgi:hypothetical protein